MQTWNRFGIAFVNEKEEKSYGIKMHISKSALHGRAADKTDPHHLGYGCPYIYPTPETPVVGMNYSDISYVYLSTEEITMTTYDVSPGGRFEPADYHAGDEVYIVLEGTLTMLNTVSGQVVNVHEGEGLLMPTGGIHVGYNFTQTKTRTMAVLAPKIFADQEFPTDTVGTYNVMNPRGEKQFEKFAKYPGTNYMGNIGDLGAWPVDGPSAREYPQMFHYIPEEKKLLVINGQDDPLLMKFIVSNDFLNVAEVVIPAGGIGARKSAPCKHKGDAVYYIHEGTLSVFMTETRETYQIQGKEALFIPKNTEYQLFNYDTNLVTAYFCSVAL